MILSPGRILLESRIRDKEALKLKAPQVRHLRKVIAAMEEPEDEDSIEGEPEKPETTPEEVKALVNRPGVLNR